MKFLLDQDVYAVTERHLQTLGHDVATSRAFGMSQADDTDLLEKAAQEQRTNDGERRACRIGKRVEALYGRAIEKCFRGCRAGAASFPSAAVVKFGAAAFQQPLIGGTSMREDGDNDRREARYIRACMESKGYVLKE